MSFMKHLSLSGNFLSFIALVLIKNTLKRFFQTKNLVEVAKIHEKEVMLLKIKKQCTTRGCPASDDGSKQILPIYASSVKCSPLFVV